MESECAIAVLIRRLEAQPLHLGVRVVVLGVRTRIFQLLRRQLELVQYSLLLAQFAVLVAIQPHVFFAHVRVIWTWNLVIARRHLVHCKLSFPHPL